MSGRSVKHVCITLMVLGVIAVDFLANYTNTQSHNWDLFAGVALLVLVIAWVTA